ncbi:Phosphotransferase enzyme family protein [Amycolatopsis pretoriensis]|uniref:Phosphotransferase enzyme family protein n=1 Tax=Amycolatopsis pretoriensis TaxID=218821 RepID=A0A1H5QLC5_9PSEU|nr:phosphotransferase [Amycolatopsis pretoriensis]SEF26900.1 Phosphotransferase enzyme family protein [Amycolatopsis pretoriensis]
MTEIPLTGGNVSAGVVRVGDTVRRPAGPWTPSVHALLGHLHSVGFPGAPRPLGLDERGREVLEFIDGDVPWPGRVDLLLPDAAVVAVGELVRDFHDAVAGFVPPADAAWQVLMPADGAEIVAHHDLAPWNLVAGRGRWAFIDWDTAAPGTRLWDLAYAANGFALLPEGAGVAEAARRMRLMADAYDLTEAQRHELVDLLGPRARAMHDFLGAQSAAGTEPWRKLWDTGHGTHWRRRADHLDRHRDAWLRALLG